MRRLKYPSPEAAAAAEAEAQLESFAGVGKPRRKAAGPDPDKARSELREMLTHSDFGKASATHLVALYEWCHEQVYGARPAEIEKRTAWKMVVFAASRMIRDDFGGDVAEVIAFIRWTWQREKARERARRAQPDSRVGRIGWRLQFVTKYLLTDYRIAKARGDA